jgi:ribosomal protein L21E
VNPAFSKSVTKLYSFSFSSVVKGNNVYNNIRDRGSSSSSACSKSGASSSLPSASTTGVVVAVRDNSFDLKQRDGSLVTINIAPCTSLNSNKKKYKIKSGDVAVVKGSKQSSKVYSGQSVTCLSEK